jgi:hypothetical protein
MSDLFGREPNRKSYGGVTRNAISNEYAMFIRPFDTGREFIIVPERFEIRILSHVIAPYLDNDSIFQSPLFLAIIGSVD